MHIPSLFVSCVYSYSFMCIQSHVYTGCRVAKEVYQLLRRCISPKTPLAELTNMFQLDFSPKAAILSSLMEHKTSVEQAAKLVCKLNGRYPSLSGRLELGYSWLDAVDKLLQDCCLPDKH